MAPIPGLPPPGLFEFAGRIVLCHQTISLRPALPDDEAFLHELFSAVRGPEFALTGLPAATIQMLVDQQFRARHAGYAASFPASLSLVVSWDDKSVGRLLLGTRPADLGWAVHLIDIAIAPAYQGRGIGTDLISALAKAAGAQGASELSLSVFAKNDKARALYERLGIAATKDGVSISMSMPLACPE